MDYITEQRYLLKVKFQPFIHSDFIEFGFLFEFCLQLKPPDIKCNDVSRGFYVLTPK
jgi:hypothetical protein